MCMYDAVEKYFVFFYIGTELSMDAFCNYKY